MFYYFSYMRGNGLKLLIATILVANSNLVFGQSKLTKDQTILYSNEGKYQLASLDSIKVYTTIDNSSLDVNKVIQKIDQSKNIDMKLIVRVLETHSTEESKLNELLNLSQTYKEVNSILREELILNLNKN